MSSYENNNGQLTLIDGMRSVAEVKQLMLQLCYPIGSMYISTVNTSPATFLGGTWIQHSGYVLRGATSGVTDGTSGQTNDGGADSVTVSSVASHQHPSKTLTGDVFFSDSNMVWNASGSGIVGLRGANKKYYQQDRVVNAGSQADGWTINASHQHDASGANYTVNTLPKYKNVYIWERTA